MTQDEWRAKYGKMSAMAERISKMRTNRFRALCREAHVENGLMLHNAMVGLHYNKPWAEVNYTAAKKAYHLDQTGWLFEASRILERWSYRVWNEARGKGL